MRKDLIMDDGKIRMCDSNVDKLGYFGTLWHLMLPNAYLEFASDILEAGMVAFKSLGLFLAGVILFPFIPFIMTITRVRTAKRNCKRYG